MFFDSKSELQKDDWTQWDAAEIDHIIPRVDSKGCLCGDVTPNNAAVISREMNHGMSNTSPLYDENRSKMFEQYVTCQRGVEWQYQPPPRPLPPYEYPIEHHQVDEALVGVDFEMDGAYAAREAPNETVETSGCSAGGATSFGVLLAFLGLRRRRAAASA